MNRLERWYDFDNMSMPWNDESTRAPDYKACVIENCNGFIAGTFSTRLFWVETNERADEICKMLNELQSLEATHPIRVRHGFHDRDNWHWHRMQNGGVGIRHYNGPCRGDVPGGIDFAMVIPENVWASIVCSVSKEGETGERWDAARKFHGVI